METKRLLSIINHVAVIISRYAYINLLWVAFVLLGGVIFGIMPATISMFTVIRKWLHQNSDDSIFQTFYYTYKQEFIKSNTLMAVLLVFAVLLYSNIAYAGLIRETSLYPFFLAITFIALSLYIILMLYIAPVYVHYQFTFKRYLAYSIHIGLANILHTTAMVVSLLGFYYLSMKFPGIILFFSFSVSASIVDFFAQFSFNNLQTQETTVKSA
ncbi:YesL family protein [Amphibacillus cookii]|uniref:YesL family protein n=1 Tax=Amphibacillus cookii TaxID=767787 RepID=UPI00195D2979|nr:DUF624 domain-containing protein [Amphibacillus cookii]MBM7540698.1 putative membrane protein YesL [Amphibacillus cookii]